MTTPLHRLAAAAIFAVAITPTLRWLILHHSVHPGQPWRTSCNCGHPLWPSACGPSARCRICGFTPGPPTYLIEAVTITVATIAILSARGLWQTAAALWWTAGAVVLATVDVSVRRLPHRITAVTTVGFLGLHAIAMDVAELKRAMIAATLLAAIFAFAAYVTRGQLGWGDVTLAVPVTAYLAMQGWTAVMRGYLAGFVAALAYVIVTRIVRRPSRTLPLGPFLLAGALMGPHM